MNERILVAHEWLEMTGGSENCFEQMVRALPGCRTAALWNNAPTRFPDIDRQSWLAQSRLRRSKAAALPFMMSAWRSIPLSDVDTVLASSHAFAHALAGRAARQGKRGFAYVHTPARYVWAADIDPRGAGAAARLASRYLKRVDRASTHPAVSYAANSEFVRSRVQNAWDVDCEVIYPSVDLDGNRLALGDLSAEEEVFLSKLPDGFILGASRLIEYKRLDTVIEVGAAIGRPVVLVGSGADEERLRSVAEGVSVPVIFAGRVSAALLQALYRAADVLVFPPIEDFGIVPVEAIAWGTPVVVGPIGGAREGVERTRGGFVAEDDRLDSFAEAVAAALEIDMTEAKVRAEQFSSARFRNEIAAWVASR